MTRLARIALALVLPLSLATPAQALQGSRPAFGVGVLRTQARGFDRILEQAESMRDLALRASAESLRQGTRLRLNQLFWHEGHTLNAVAWRAEYGGLSLLDVWGFMNVQSSPGSTQFVQVHLYDVTTDALGLNSLNLLTLASAQEALWTMEDTLEALAPMRQQNCADLAALGVEPGCAQVATYCTSTPNSTGQAARLEGSGSLDLDAELLLLLRATDCPPGQMGWFVMGREEVDIPFGNGTLCVGGSPASVLRISPGHPVMFNGLALKAIGRRDFEPYSLFTPGSTWRFQFIFRDSVGAGFDATNAVAATWEG